MNKEIKKILEEFENLFEVSEAPEHIIKDFNKIKDYITNLEEALERMEEEIGELQEEIDKYVKIIDKIKEKLKEKDENGFEKIYVEDALYFVNELLEEIE